MNSRQLQKVCILPGDGIGPEVVAQAVKVIKALSEKFSHDIVLNFGLIGAAAIDETGEPFPEQTYQLCLDSDAILLGAIGDPKYDDPTLKVRPEQGLLAMRKALGLFANIRPIKTYNGLEQLSVLKPQVLAGTDFVIFRELTGGIYFGEKVKGDGYASDLCTYHDFEIERVSHLAFQMAANRRKKVTLVDKANVLETSRLWRAKVTEIAKQYPSITLDFLYIDNAAMQVILNPARFDVVLCDNLFGDILSDEASVITGSLGMLPSSSRGDKHSLYEPCHGSYPQAAKRDIANPIATILSLEMMYRDFGHLEEADAIIKAVDFCIEYQLLTEDMKAVHNCGCSQMGDIISTFITEGREGLKTRKLHESLSTIV
jgi:3-isopropylmalate dehydrogenase